MTFDEYKEIILNGERVEWYGEMVPNRLLTPQVYAIANMISESLNKMEADIADMHGNSKQKESKQRYINDRWRHIKTLPYHSNGLIHDHYMAKYKRIIQEEEEKNKKKKKPSTRKTRTKKADPTSVKNTQVEKSEKETTPKEKVAVKGRKTKNSKLIFGK